MRNFLSKALEKFSKLNRGQVKDLLFELASENGLYEAVLNSIMNGLIVTNIENEIVFKNKSADRLIPLHTDEPGGALVWQLIADPDIAEFVKKSILAQENVTDKEFSLHRGGQSRVLNCSLLPLVSRGSIQGTLFSVEDITEKREKEARLRRAENLASLTTLAAGVAHEIKNPLGSIGIHLQLIDKTIQENPTCTNDRISKFLQIINEEVDRLNRIVVDFLFAVRPMNAEFEKTDINKLIQDLVEFLQYELEDNNIQTEMDLGKEIGSVCVDVRYIKQALLNIIKNAIYAMESGGVLRIQTEVADDDLCIHIIDNGSGIPDELMEKVFEPYFTTKDFGSGLGLTVVYKIIKEHRGDINVQSKEGEGTRFTLILPLPHEKTQLIDYQGESHEV